MAMQRGVMSAVLDPVGKGQALRAWPAVPWRALLACALLSLALGAALYDSLAGGRVSVAPARFRASSHLHAGASSRRKGLSSLPPAAQGPVSEAVGADSRAYRVGASGNGFRAASPAQHLSTSFNRSGVSVVSGRARVALSMRAMGFGTSLQALADVAPRVRANRVSYARARLGEWYVNGPASPGEVDALAPRRKRGPRIAAQRHRDRQRPGRMGEWRPGDREALLHAERPVHVPLAEARTRIGDAVGPDARGDISERLQRRPEADRPHAQPHPGPTRDDGDP